MLTVRLWEDVRSEGEAWVRSEEDEEVGEKDNAGGGRGGGLGVLDIVGAAVLNLLNLLHQGWTSLNKNPSLSWGFLAPIILPEL